jgi:RNA-binding protein
MKGTFMITSKQRAYLRSQANALTAIMQIGKGGISENLSKTISDALEARELIKLHVLENSGEDPYVLLQELAAELEAEPVAVVGRKIVLYRASKKHPTIELPKA